MYKALKLWWINRQIKHLERLEAEQRRSLIHLQVKVLPNMRQRRNNILYYSGVKHAVR